MSDDIRWKIGVVQMDCVLGDVAANLRRISDYAAAAGRLGVELLVFPETATTGYFVADRLAELAEPADGRTGQALGAIAKANGLHMAVGVVSRAGERCFDAQLLFGPSGALLAEYRKVHLFAAERDAYAAGDAPVVVDTPLGRIGMSICYDLIFGDYIRRLTTLGADLVINSTNWIGNTYQRETWGWSGPVTQGLAATRALEHGTFVAMANRVGQEQGFDSLGYSCVAGPSGKTYAALQDGEGLAIADIAVAADDLRTWRSIATYRQDRRPALYGDA